MKVNSDGLASRIPVWKALSILFLDSELKESDFVLAADQIRRAGISASEAEMILWNEVFPALCDNLRIGTGEWGYFSTDWLVDRIAAVLDGSQKGPGKFGLISVGQTREIISAGWSHILKFLES